MKRYIAVLLLLVGSLPTTAQTNKGSISGRVTTADGKPAAYINIALKTTQLGTTTSENGAYQLANIPVGTYTLIASGVGFDTRTEQVTVSDSLPVEVNLQLTAQVKQLQTVEIYGRKETSYKNTEGTFIGTKTGTLLKDVPQSIGYVTKELISDQQALRLGELVKNVSGVNQFSGYDDYTLRGFRSEVQLQNGLKVYGGFWKQPLLFNLERIEVIKGPAGALFGRTDPGGTINRVTKKPLDENRKSVSFSTGSYNTFRLAGDFTGPMNEDKTLLYRLNLGYENAETFRDLQTNNNLVVAPSFTFLPSEKTPINFDFVYSRSNSRLDRGQPIFGATAGTSLTSTPISFAIQATDDYLKEDNISLTASLSHQFAPNLSFNTSYMKFYYIEDLVEHRTASTYAKDSLGKERPTLMEMQYVKRARRYYTDNISNYFVWDTRTGAIEHKILLGYDYLQEGLAPGGSQIQAGGYRNAENTGAVNRFDPKKKSQYLLDANGNPVPNVPHFDLTLANPYALANPSDYIINTITRYGAERYYVNGLYIQDQLKIGKLQVLLGLRQEYFTNYINFRAKNEQKVTQKALIPRLGLVYALNPQINVYATYAQGFQPQAATSLSNPNAGGPFDPQTSELYEVGAKSEWFDKRLSITTAIYNLTKNNVLVNANQPGNPDLLVQRGQERARGVEFDIIGNVLPNLSVLANYAYNNAIISKDLNEANVGRRKENAPQHQGSYWIKYLINNGKLRNLGLALGSNFVTERNTMETTLQLPGYVIHNAALYYQTGKYRLSANFNNLTNKTYWTGGYSYVRLFPGTPRNFLATVAYTF